jgi:hypothetical protein
VRRDDIASLFPFSPLSSTLSGFLIEPLLRFFQLHPLAAVSFSFCFAVLATSPVIPVNLRDSPLSLVDLGLDIVLMARPPSWNSNLVCALEFPPLGYLFLCDLSAPRYNIHHLFRPSQGCSSLQSLRGRVPRIFEGFSLLTV